MSDVQRAVRAATALAEPEGADGIASLDPAVPVLALRNVWKTFAGTQALKGIELDIAPGEVHALVGQNGSGKSTLIKILAGFHEPDGGELLIDGEAVRLPLAPGQFRDLGMSFVHQDLGLVESLSVVENLRVAELASSRSRWGISWRAERRRAEETFERYGLRIDPRAIVGELKPVERALLAIVRALEEIRAVVRASSRGDSPAMLLASSPKPRSRSKVIRCRVRKSGRGRSGQPFQAASWVAQAFASAARRSLPGIGAKSVSRPTCSSSNTPTLWTASTRLSTTIAS